MYGRRFLGVRWCNIYILGYLDIIEVSLREIFRDPDPRAAHAATGIYSLD